MNFTFSSFASDPSKIDVIFLAGSNYVGFDMRPLNPNDNPWMADDQNHTNNTSFIAFYDYRVTTTGSALIDGSLLSVSFANFSAFNTASASEFGLSSNDPLITTCTINFGTCLDRTALNGVNFDAPTQTANMELTLEGSIGAEASFRSVAITSLQQIFLFNPVTIQTITNPPLQDNLPPSTTLSNGDILQFPLSVPEPESIALFSIGLVGLCFSRSRKITHAIS